jgi:hypothetical protein
LSKVKEIKRLCGGVVYYAAQASAQIDAEIGQKDHLWMETNYCIRYTKNRCQEMFFESGELRSNGLRLEWWSKVLENHSRN